MSFSKLPIIRSLHRRFQIFSEAMKLYIPPGHFYSPIVSQKEVSNDADRIFPESPRKPLGVDLREEAQLSLLETFYQNYPEIPLPDEPTGEARFYLKNGFYSYSDAIFTFCILKHFKPNQIIEAGSGFSSALMLDLNQRHLDHKMRLEFIDPNPERLYSLMNENDQESCVIHPVGIQSLDLKAFTQLDLNDILFIDSSHVSKTGSDLNHILFEVLPQLKPGVLIHFHDIFYPFEYPKAHVLGDRWFSWNECYLLHAFLCNNSDFEIVFWNAAIEEMHPEKLRSYYPDFFKGGSRSLWIRRK